MVRKPHGPRNRRSTRAVAGNVGKIGTIPASASQAETRHTVPSFLFLGLFSVAFKDLLLEAWRNRIVVFSKDDERYHDIITLKRSSSCLKTRLLDSRLLADLDEQATYGIAGDMRWDGDSKIGFGLPTRSI